MVKLYIYIYIYTLWQSLHTEILQKIQKISLRDKLALKFKL